MCIRDSDYIATSFLETNNINYETSAGESADQSIADIAEAAQQFTGIIMCYR